MKPVCDWFSSNKWTDGPTKCEPWCIDCGKPEKIEIGSAELNHKRSCKNFGVHLHKKLIFYGNIENIVEKQKKFCSFV